MAQSPNTKMDVANLAKVFGPTIVAHAVPNPDPVVMLQDIKRQPKVSKCPLYIYIHTKDLYVERDTYISLSCDVIT